MPTIPSELPLIVPDRWSCVTIYRHQTKKDREAKIPPEPVRHELMFGNRVHETDKGERGLKRLREMADLFNRMKVAPRDRAIQCLADESGSVESKLAKQNRRAAKFTATVVRK